MASVLLGAVCAHRIARLKDVAAERGALSNGRGTSTSSAWSVIDGSIQGKKDGTMVEAYAYQLSSRDGASLPPDF
jgi:hypothetical protein